MFFPSNFAQGAFDARRLHPDAAQALEALVDADPVRRAMIRTVLSDPNGAVELLTGWLLSDETPERAAWMLALLHRHPILELRPRAWAGLVRVAAETESAFIRRAAQRLLAEPQEGTAPRDQVERLLYGKPRRSG